MIRTVGIVSARRETFVAGSGLRTEYSLGPEAEELPRRDDIQIQSDDSPLDRILVSKQEYVVCACEVTSMPTGRG